MKELTIIHQQELPIVIDDIKQLEKKHNITISNNITNFILKYGGTTVKEICFNNIYFIHQFLDIKLIDAILEGHKDYEVFDYLPFVIDGGGWDYNVSLKKETYGQIWVNKWDNGDGVGEECFFFIANSFEEFIDGLQAEEGV